MPTLEPGDIFLSLGDREFSDEIKRITGGFYSHATLWTGDSVVEATLPRVHELSPEAFAKKSQYLDAFRHLEVAGNGAAIVENGRGHLLRPYSTLDLIVAIAIGTFTAWTKSSIPWAAWNLQYHAGRVESLVGRLRSLRRAYAEKRGEKKVTCVELVVRAHLLAGLPIKVQLDPGGKVDFDKLWKAIRALLDYKWEAAREHESEQDRETVTDRLHHDVAWLEGIHRGVRDKAQLEAPVPYLRTLELEVGEEWDAELVTPHQLANSRSFNCLGTVPKNEFGPLPVRVSELDPERRQYRR